MTAALLKSAATNTKQNLEKVHERETTNARRIVSLKAGYVFALSRYDKRTID